MDSAKMVPREPTPAMYREGTAAYTAYPYSEAGKIAAIWRAMWDAAQMPEGARREAQYPHGICCACGERYGREREGHISTWNLGTCGWCGEARYVTEPRDYGYPKPL